MGDSIREGLEGLSKIDSFADHLYIAIYWVGVIFVILFVAYLFAALNCYINRKRRGVSSTDNDDFLDD